MFTASRTRRIHQAGRSSFSKESILVVDACHPAGCYWTALATTPCSLSRLLPERQRWKQSGRVSSGITAIETTELLVFSGCGFLRRRAEEVIRSSFLLKFTSDFLDGSIKICQKWDIQCGEKETHERREGEVQLRYQSNGQRNQKQSASTLQLHYINRV